MYSSDGPGVKGKEGRGELAFIAGTEQTLDCAIYDFRDPAILDACARLVQDGKQVRIVFDGGKQRSGGFIADPKPDGTELALREAHLIDYARAIHEGRYLMHDKFMVRDKTVVWTGSANFTQEGVYDPNGMKDVMRSTRQDSALFWFVDDKEHFVAAPFPCI